MTAAGRDQPSGTDSIIATRACGTIRSVFPINLTGGARRRHGRVDPHHFVQGRARALRSGAPPPVRHARRLTQTVEFVGAPAETARDARRWIEQLTGRLDHGADMDHRSAVRAQIRGFGAVLRVAGAALVDVIDRIAGADATYDPVKPTMVHVHDVDHWTDAAADILITIDSLARLAGGGLAAPAEVLCLITWIAEEVDAQSVGLPSRRYTNGRPPAVAPCPLLRASEHSDRVRPTLHAYGHAGLSDAQVTCVRRLRVASALSEAPGAPLDDLVARLQMSRWEVLDELGDLIGLGAVFGIGYHWYLYDIAALASADVAAVRNGCRCPDRLTWA